MIKTLFTIIGLTSAAFAEKPNIILFVTDDQSPIAGCYGNKVIQTPHLDALAAVGTMFTHAYATTASCSASRSVIMTGVHNHANGQYGHAHAYHKFATSRSMTAISLPNQLRLSGYRTAQIGKYHVAPESVYHFDSYLRGSNPVGMAEGAKSFIEKKDELPFFLYLATHSPHRSSGTNSLSNLKLKPNLFQNKDKKQHHKGVKEVFYQPKDVKVPAFLPDTSTCRAEIAEYYQSCSRVDQGLGRLVEILKAAGKWDNTIIIFTADHGMAFPGAKTTVYEAGLHVPFVVRDPRVKKATVNDALISHLDITPTILDFAGGLDTKSNKPLKRHPVEAIKKFENIGKAIKRYQGKSWRSLLGTEASQGWDSISASHTFHEIQMYYPMRAVRDRNYKLIWNVAYRQPYPFASDLWAASTWQAQYQQGPATKYGARTVESYIQRPQFELYDIKKDPAETINLATQEAHKETLKIYKTKLKEMQKSTSDPWALKWKYE